MFSTSLLLQGYYPQAQSYQGPSKSMTAREVEQGTPGRGRKGLVLFSPTNRFKTARGKVLKLVRLEPYNQRDWFAPTTKYFLPCILLKRVAVRQSLWNLSWNTRGLYSENAYPLLFSYVCLSNKSNKFQCTSCGFVCTCT